ncbi:hypothetical protein JM93_01265 [Roseibium hamelinense]|uniref:Uncharacterized protein n=1 Tax=Roseibium hamelinense TaxID=150831 RepID=A0A562T9N5_9HYPH|nr:hypothetical protein [Roseibium hamelinense]MTI45348.1 hypothetical protein [Roseibium hamelinense]TWI90285.1 hypothetical protein JM93_01265 [Roseibium hamelinense]
MEQELGDIAQRLDAVLADTLKRWMSALETSEDSLHLGRLHEAYSYHVSHIVHLQKVTRTAIRSEAALGQGDFSYFEEAAGSFDLETKCVSGRGDRSTGSLGRSGYTRGQRALAGGRAQKTGAPSPSAAEETVEVVAAGETAVGTSVNEEKQDGRQNKSRRSGPRTK